MVALVSGVTPETSGRTWTAQEYDARDAQLAALGVSSLRASGRGG
jgi:hypothetical protein